MSKAIFSGVTLVVVLAIGVLIYNRATTESTENADATKVSATVAGKDACCAKGDDCCGGTGACCAAKAGSAEGKSCCKESATETVSIEAKKTRCGGVGGACCSGDGGACPMGDNCCAKKDAQPAEAGVAVSTAVALPCGCIDECHCEKKDQ